MPKRIGDLKIDHSTQDPSDPEYSLLVKEKQVTLKAIEELDYKLTPA